MAYRSWHRDGGRPPPPPYSRHKYSASAASGHTGNSATTNNSTFSGDTKFSSDMFKDMSKKIAQLTKVICSLTNKVEDQEQVLQSTKREHQEKVGNLQSELKQKCEEYKNKVRALEVLLQEEQKHTLKKEEELKKLKQFCVFAENCRFFKDSLARGSPNEKTSISGVDSPEDSGRSRPEFSLKRSPASLHLDSKLLFSSTVESLQNGGSEFTFIGNKLRDMESYEKEIRFLIDSCERLKAEKMSLHAKYESNFHDLEKQSSKSKDGKEGMICGSSNCEGRLSEINLKEQIEKQDLQYRKRISDLLQCLTQSESRAEKYRKEIKQLEEVLSSRDKQNSLITADLSKTLDHLKQSRTLNADMQEMSNRQSQEISTKNDIISKLENERQNYDTQLSSAISEIQQVRNKLKESQEQNVRLQQAVNEKETDFKELQQLRNKLVVEQKRCEQLQRDYELKFQSIHDNNDVEKKKLEERIESLMRSSLQQERAYFQQLEEAKMRYELHMEEERLVHREIQDNLEQQLELLHRNVQHTIRNEEEEVATLHLLLGDKEVSLNKTQKQLKEAREMADRMKRLIKLKEMELEKVREQQKIHHSTEVRFTVQNSSHSTTEVKQQNTIHEFPVVFARSEISEEKLKFLKGRIKFLEEQNNFLRMEKEKIRKSHLLVIEAQSEAHKKELENLKEELMTNAKDGEILRTFTQEHTGEKTPNEMSQKGKFQDYSTEMEVENYREKCAELKEALKKLDEDSFSTKEKLRSDLNEKQDQVKKLTSLIETLQAEHGRVVLEREAKMNEMLRVRCEASQQIKNLENYWQERLVRELKKASHSFESEKQKLISHFNKGQRLLKDKIVLLQSIIKDLKDRKFKHEFEEENMEAVHELQKTIEEKDAIINKLKEEKKALHIELLNQRENSTKASSSQPLTNSMENMFALKKPRLERPPLTPQLVRRHSLLGSSEQKWLRARSQSPMRGFQTDGSSAPKSTLPAGSVHRSSWTGEISTDFSDDSSLNGGSDTNTKGQANNSVASTNDVVHSTENCNSLKENPLQLKSEQEKYNISQHSHESVTNHICDTIAECDELLMTIEDDDKQSTLTLKEEVKNWADNQIMESEV